MIAFNNELFNREIQGSKPVLVDFWAPWCVYCRRIGPALEAFALENPHITVAKVNIDEEPALAQAERIEVIPTLILYQNGQAIGSIVAPESKARIEEFVKNALGG